MLYIRFYLGDMFLLVDHQRREVFHKVKSFVIMLFVQTASSISAIYFECTIFYYTRKTILNILWTKHEGIAVAKCISMAYLNGSYHGMQLYQYFVNVLVAET